MVKVSIIVPIYNVERYLRRSIESIQNQTLKDIEIILVNDGSLDDSLSICNEYAGKDKRIKVIDKPNGGVSSARNAGIEIASGEYIGFIDPDDWIELEMYENMYRSISETKSDICISDYIIENNRNIRPIILDIEKEILNKKGIIDQIIPDMISAPDLNSNAQTIAGTVWRLLIDKALINKYNFRFSEEIIFMEDLVFCMNIFLKCEKIIIDRGQYYHYMINEDSVSKKYRKDIFEMRNSVFNKIKDILVKDSVYELYEDRLNIRYVDMVITSIANQVHNANDKKQIEKISGIKNICKDNKLKEILKNTNTKGYTLRKKVTLYAIEKELSLYLYLYYIFINRVINR